MIHLLTHQRTRLLPQLIAIHRNPSFTIVSQVCDTFVTFDIQRYFSTDSSVGFGTKHVDNDLWITDCVTYDIMLPLNLQGVFMTSLTHSVDNFIHNYL